MAGFDHYLVKPVDSTQLLDLLAQHSAQLQSGQARSTPS